MTAQAFKDELAKYGSAEGAAFLQHFFKTAEGQYGEGDVFMGARVPQIRMVCKRFRDMPLGEVTKLLASPLHEHRLAAVILLASQYAKADEPAREKIYNVYLRAVHEGRVNNWDIVDSSAALIVGAHLRDRPRDMLEQLARSKQLWERRVAVISTFEFLKHGDPVTTLIIAEILLHDQQDLIQKAVGWMLREMGKRVDRAILLQFLDKYAYDMPRTTLRYSIEHLPAAQRAYYLGLKAKR